MGREFQRHEGLELPFALVFPGEKAHPGDPYSDYDSDDDHSFGHDH